jgi:hypothetical protein
MILDLDFRSADFHGLSQEEQIARSREMAIEAMRLAANASDEKRGEYLDLATRWIALADEMERNRISRSQGESYVRLK